MCNLIRKDHLEPHPLYRGLRNAMIEWILNHANPDWKEGDEIPTITYGKLGSNIGRQGKGVGFGFDHYLAHLCVRCRDYDLPFLPSLILNRHKEIGPGFWAAVRELDQIPKSLREYQIEAIKRNPEDWNLLYLPLDPPQRDD